MEYTAHLTLRTDEPLTEDQAFAVAAVGGAVGGRPGGRHLETTVTVAGAGPGQAAQSAVDAVTALVPSSLVALELLTTEEADRRLGQGPGAGAPGPGPVDAERLLDRIDEPEDRLALAEDDGERIPHAQVVAASEAEEERTP